jgi:hypothetical protein
METKSLEKLARQLRHGPTEELTFETVATDANILKAQIVRDGKARSVYVLAVPEDSIDDFIEEDFANALVTEPEMA